jgi:hypothetical protein
MDQRNLTIPSCRSCGTHDALRWVSRVERRDKLVAERWVCLRCSTLVAVEPPRHLGRWVLTALVAISLPTLWWRRSRQVWEPRRAA